MFDGSSKRRPAPAETTRDRPDKNRFKGCPHMGVMIATRSFSFDDHLAANTVDQSQREFTFLTVLGSA